MTVRGVTVPCPCLRFPAALLFLWSMVVPFHAAAQQTADTTGIADACSELRASVLTYAETEIVPRMQVIRGDFERALSDSDRLVLGEIRTGWQQALDGIERQNRELAALRDMDDYPAIADNRSVLRAWIDSTRAARAQLRDLLDRNKKQAEDLRSALMSASGKWQGGLMRFFVEWNAANRQMIEAAMNTGAEQRLSDFLRGAMTFHFGQPIDDEFLRFLLWDGTSFTGRMRELHSLSAGHPLVLPFDEHRLEPIRGVYPDPFKERATVQVMLPCDGPLRVHLRDAQGDVTAVLFDGPADAGEHRLPLDGSTLPAGRYYVELTCGGVYDLRTADRAE